MSSKTKIKNYLSKLWALALFLILIENPWLNQGPYFTYQLAAFKKQKFQAYLRVLQNFYFMENFAKLLNDSLSKNYYNFPKNSFLSVQAWKIVSPLLLSLEKNRSFLAHFDIKKFDLHEKNNRILIIKLLILFKKLFNINLKFFTINLKFFTKSNKKQNNNLLIYQSSKPKGFKSLIRKAKLNLISWEKHFYQRLLIHKNNFIMKINQDLLITV